MIRILSSYIGKFLLLVGIAGLAFSCKKENGPWWEADFSGPIAKSSLNISNLLPDSILSSDPDSSLRIVYDETVFNYAIDSLVSIADTTIDTNYILPVGPATFAPGQGLFAAPPSENHFSTNSASLTYAILKSGVIKLEAGNSVIEPVVFQYDILNSNQGGSMFSISEEVPGGSISNPGTLVKYYSLNGMEVDLTGLNNDKYNTLTTQSSVSISPLASAGSINAGEGLSVKLTFMDIVPLYGKGYLGNQVFVAGPDTISFDFLKGLNADYFALQDASVNMRITNGFGVDMSAAGVQLISVNTKNNTSVTLSGSGVYSTYNLNRATYTGNSSNPVIPTVKNFPLNSANSNIKAFIENLPDKIAYTTNAQVNPLGNVSGNNDFIYYGYGFRTDLQMDIPLAFAATNLCLQDTADLNLSGMTEAENINHGELVLRVENGYPFDADIQGFVCDENYNVVDSLFAAPHVAAPGLIDASLKVTAPQLSLLHIPLDHAKLDRIRAAKKIIFKVRMNTVAQTQIVKLYDYYSINLVLTGDINYSVNKQ